MGEGVSLSLPRKGVPGADLRSSVVSVPFTKELVYYISLPRNGESGVILFTSVSLVSSVPCAREHVSSGGSYFPESQAEIDDDAWFLKVLPDTGRFHVFFHKPFLHREGVDLGYRKAFGRRNSSFAGEFGPGRQFPGFNGAVYAHVCRIGAVSIWVPVDLPELRGLKPRTPNPGVGCMIWGPHVGGMATTTAETSDGQAMPMPSSNSSGLLIYGYEHGPPGPVVGRIGGRFEGKESTSMRSIPDLHFFPME